jgi:hypothetical protein
MVVESYFYRSGICCALELMNDGWSWWCYTGLEPEHPMYGSGYVQLPHKSVAKIVVPSFAVDNRLSERWWMGFQADGCSHESVTKQLKDVADDLAAIREGDRCITSTGWVMI